MHAKPGNPTAEPGPPLIGSQRGRHHRPGIGRCGDAGALADAVLDVVDLSDERRGRHDGVGAVLLEQREAGPLGARDGVHRIGGDAGQQILQAQPAGGQPPQGGQAVTEVAVLGDSLIRV